MFCVLYEQVLKGKAVDESKVAKAMFDIHDCCQGNDNQHSRGGFTGEMKLVLSERKASETNARSKTAG